ncbi:hypothetical protein LTR10_000845 [Elasticomyces elasticus]|nr:hypothetical protein LTR10_000845 [Elasticomyces elasticus]KAK4979909.1 hypothetical protein LTR42_000216 [Elasticomyces elasticus]
MATPTELVFGVTELLEAILLAVDMKTLLLSQRVSSVFRDTISTSPRLLEKLYLRQSPAPAVLPHVKDIINPLIAKNTIRMIKCPDRLPKWTDARTGRDSTGLLFRPFDQALRIVLTALDLTPLTTPFYQQESDQIEASWLRMYLYPFQPPADAKHITVQAWLCDRGADAWFTQWDTKACAAKIGGLKMGALIEQAKESLLLMPEEAWADVRAIRLTWRLC